LNPDSLLEKLRHSGEGRNPDDSTISHAVGQNLGFVCFAVFFLGWIPAFAGMTA
jgi:hypothetical protein